MELEKMTFIELWAHRRSLASIVTATARGAETEKRGLTPDEEKRMSDATSALESVDRLIETRAKNPAPGAVPFFPTTPENQRMERVTTRSILTTMSSESLEFRALASGGGGIPKFIQTILDAMYEVNPVRRLAEVYTIAGDAAVPVPGAYTAGWGAEGAVIAAADPSITPVALSAFNCQGRIIVNDATLDDDFYGVEKLLAQSASGSLGEAEAAAMLGAGAGADRPQGIFNGGTTHQTITTNAAPVLQDILNWLGSLPTKYRNGTQASLMHPGVFNAILGLKDATGRLEVDYRSMSLNGVPLVLSSLCPAYATTTGSKLAAFGNFKRGYAIAQRASDKGTIKTKIVPSQDAFANNVLFNERIDGRIVDGAAYSVLTVK